MDDGLVRKPKIPLKDVYSAWVRKGMETRIQALLEVEEAMEAIMQGENCEVEGLTPMLAHLSLQHSNMLHASLANSGQAAAAA